VRCPALNVPFGICKRSPSKWDNGHFTEDKNVTFKNFAGQYAFLLWQTGDKDFQPEK
jgi:hypothetical protein